MVEHVERHIKIETIHRSVVKCSDLSIPALKDRLIGECGAWWGTAKRTAQEYLDELVSRDQIVIDGNDVWSWIRWQKILKAREKDYLKMEDILNGQRNL